ncbi:hypothetical protein N431DRAFT_431006 [Stipitochalara longipes BDJ]|nr:hypothetical protein N431DRAFT_431006 [Stipitochalara longipes BDJ]
MVASTYFSRASSSTPTRKLWDPTTTLRIINTDPGYQCITCVGHAPSKGRRCRIAIRSDNRDFITNTLDEIAYLSPSSPAVLSRLRSIAAAGLCVRYHQGQVETVVMQWQRKMQQVQVEVESKPQLREQKPRKASRVGKQEYEEDVNDLKQQLRELQEMLAQFQEERKSQGQYARSNEQAEKKKREEERAREEREEREKRAKKEEEERLEKERIEKERKENERKENERKENERRDQEKAKQRAREQAEYNERIRQRAQKIREEREQARRDAEKKAEEEWEQAWTTYQERWVQFRNSTSREGNIRTAIPWPVKSGLYSDVKASNAKEFLEKAAKKDANPSKLLRKECQKWHPDTMDRWLRGVELTVAERMVIDAICRVVTGLLDTYSGRSSELFD